MNPDIRSSEIDAATALLSFTLSRIGERRREGEGGDEVRRRGFEEEDKEEKEKSEAIHTIIQVADSEVRGRGWRGEDEGEEGRGRRGGGEGQGSRDPVGDISASSEEKNIKGKSEEKQERKERKKKRPRSSLDESSRYESFSFSFSFSSQEDSNLSVFLFLRLPQLSDSSPPFSSSFPFTSFQLFSSL